MLDKKINILVVSLFIGVFVIPATLTNLFGRVENHLTATAMPTPVSGKPPYSAYKGVTIGSTMDEARSKLGPPKEKSDEQDFFVFSDSESAQVYYDGAKTVTAITVTYVGNLSTAPSPKDVFGEEAEAKPDGGIFKMVRYPKAGFWISYNKTGGDDPLIMIALQKM
jgi:hypothetical protein